MTDPKGSSKEDPKKTLLGGIKDFDDQRLDTLLEGMSGTGGSSGNSFAQLIMDPRVSNELRSGYRTFVRGLEVDDLEKVRAYEATLTNIGEVLSWLELSDDQRKALATKLAKPSDAQENVAEAIKGAATALEQASTSMTSWREKRWADHDQKKTEREGKDREAAARRQELREAPGKALRGIVNKFRR